MGFEIHRSLILLKNGLCSDRSFMLFELRFNVNAQFKNQLEFAYKIKIDKILFIKKCVKEYNTRPSPQDSEILLSVLLMKTIVALRLYYYTYF